MKRRPRGVLATPEDILAPHSSAIIGLAEQLRALIKRCLPEAEERAYPGWKGIGYAHPEAGYVCAIFPFREHVALGFEYGALLDDPERLLKPGRTSAKKVRYVEVRRLADIHSRAIAALLKQAVALRGSSRVER